MKVRAIVHTVVHVVLATALHLCLNIGPGNAQTSHGKSKHYRQVTLVSLGRAIKVTRRLVEQYR